MILIRGKKKGMVYLRDITLNDIYRCFFPNRGDEFIYLGYAYYYKDGEELLKNFYKAVDKKCRPWYVPRWFCRLLNLFGRDNSIVRCRNQKLNRLLSKILGGIMITDVKWKYDSFRIYGSFTEEIDILSKEVCRKMEEKYADKE